MRKNTKWWKHVSKETHKRNIRPVCQISLSRLKALPSSEQTTFFFMLTRRLEKEEGGRWPKQNLKNCSTLESRRLSIFQAKLTMIISRCKNRQFAIRLSLPPSLLPVSFLIATHLLPSFFFSSFFFHFSSPLFFLLFVSPVPRYTAVFFHQDA